MTEESNDLVNIKKHKSKKIIFIILFILLSISVALGVIYLTMPRPEHVSSENTEVTAVKQKADMAANLGKFEESIDILDKAIATAKTNEDKVILKTQKIVLMINLKELNSALALAIEVEKEKKTQNIYSLLGDIYKELGQSSKAIESYKKARSYVTPNSPMGKGTLEYYDSIIKGLSES